MTPHDQLIRLARPVLGREELDAVARVFASGTLTNGRETAALEEEFATFHDVDHAVAVSNGTVGLAAIYLGLGLGPGDEILVPSMTFVSSATSILHVGATPVFVDIDPATLNLDPEDVARRITPATKAILAVHYGGQPADMTTLRSLAESHNLFLIEDAAEAHGARLQGRPVGGLGHAAMFSFTPTKNITMGEGGIITTDDPDLAHRVRLLRNHGQTAPYRHESLGWNWRLTEVQAAIGRVQLAKLPSILATKDANARHMERALGAVPGLHLPVTRPDRTHVHMLYTVSVDSGRDRVLQALQARGLEARVYFPPVHRQPLFAHLDTRLPVTDDVGERILSVPFHPLLTEAELCRIEETLAEALTGAGVGSPEGSA